MMEASTTTRKPQQPIRAGEAQLIPIDLIDQDPAQPRRDFNPQRLQELAESILEVGVLHPIKVVKHGQRYQIIHGERRWRACGLVGVAQIPCVVVASLSLEKRLVEALVENLQREDLNPIEEAQGMQRLVEEHGKTHEQVAEVLGKSRVHVSNRLRLLSLPARVIDYVRQGELEAGHAVVLCSVPAQWQLLEAQTVLRRGTSVNDLKAIVRRKYELKKKAPGLADDPDIKRLATDIAEKICCPTEINHQKTGRGKLIVSYSSIDELDALIRLLNLQD